MANTGNHLRQRFAAVRVRFCWFGTRRALSPDQKREAADTFGAAREFIGASKKLLDTRHPRWKALTAVRRDVVSLWRGMSLPYPEPGVRLIRQEDIEGFTAKMHQAVARLDLAVQSLDDEFSVIRENAKTSLGDLFNATDYPATMKPYFALEWDFPSVEPPEYLMKLNPKLWEEQRDRIAAKFDAAVRMAEEAFIQEFAGLVSHLSERLEGTEDGKKKVFRDSAINGLQEFFAKFQSLAVHDNAGLDQLVGQVQQLVQGVAPQDVRDDDGLRNRIHEQLAAVKGALDGMITEAPRRNIIRPVIPAAGPELSMEQIDAIANQADPVKANQELWDIAANSELGRKFGMPA